MKSHLIERFGTCARRDCEMPASMLAGRTLVVRISGLALLDHTRCSTEHARREDFTSALLYADRLVFR
jgi:hypothetical protein